MSKVFLDTNVLVYASDRDEPDKRRRARALLRATAADGNGMISTQVVQEFFVAATRKLAIDPLQAKAIVATLHRLDLLEVALEDINQAIDGVVLWRGSLLLGCTDPGRGRTGELLGGVLGGSERRSALCGRRGEEPVCRSDGLNALCAAGCSRMRRTCRTSGALGGVVWKDMRFFNRRTGERVGAAETAEGWQMRQRKIAKHLEAEEIVNGNKALGCGSIAAVRAGSFTDSAVADGPRCCGRVLLRRLPGCQHLESVDKVPGARTTRVLRRPSNIELVASDHLSGKYEPVSSRTSLIPHATDFHHEPNGYHGRPPSRRFVSQASSTVKGARSCCFRFPASARFMVVRSSTLSTSTSSLSSSARTTDSL